MARNQTLLKPYEKARPKQKRIMKEINNLAITGILLYCEEQAKKVCDI